jgi:hypothetical protein
MTTRAQSVWNKIALLAICELAREFNPAPITNVVIQKLGFLTEVEGRRSGVKTAYYRFFRYKHGPFSNALSWDIAESEQGLFIDSESGELLDRGRYLLKYVKPDLDACDLWADVYSIFRRTSEKWRAYRGWSIVDEVYRLSVPVDQFRGQMMLVKEIPLKTDILVPEWSSEKEFSPFSADLVQDLEEELRIPPSSLDPNSEEFKASVTAAYQRALAM